MRVAQQRYRRADPDPRRLPLDWHVGRRRSVRWRSLHAGCRRSPERTRSLLQDRDDTMWIGVSGEGLVRWGGGHFASFTPEQGLAGRDVRVLAEDSDGRIWAGTENGISVLEHGHITPLEPPEGLADNRMIAVARAPDGTVWMASSTSVCRTSGPRVTCERPASVGGRIAALLSDSAGTLWIGTDAALFANGARVLDGSIAELLESRSGGVWIGFATSEVARLRGADLDRYGGMDGLPTEGGVTALHEDREGSLWIVTSNGGLTRLKHKRVTMFTRADGLPAAAIPSRRGMVLGQHPWQQRWLHAPGSARQTGESTIEDVLARFDRRLSGGRSPGAYPLLQAAWRREGIVGQHRSPRLLRRGHAAQN
jgi:ligand-binding sensor domain-containing protein